MAEYTSIRIWSDTMKELDEVGRFLYERHKIDHPSRVAAIGYVVRRYKELNIDKGK